MKAFRLLLLLIINIGIIVFGNVRGETLIWPVPTSPQHFILEQIASPKLDSEPGKSTPMGIGLIADGGTTVRLQVAVGSFGAAVDIYLLLEFNGQWWFFSDKDQLLKYQDQLNPWRHSITTGFIRQLLGPLKLNEVSVQDYQLHLYVFPHNQHLHNQQTKQAFYHWQLDVDRAALIPGQDRQLSYIAGQIKYQNELIGGALVHLNTEPFSTASNSYGYFQLDNLLVDKPVIFSVWAPGFYNQDVLAMPGIDTNMEIELQPYKLHDNKDYIWQGAASHNNQTLNCVHCHSNPTQPQSYLPFDDWQQSSHAQSATNPLFLSMYQGSDLDGNVSPPTEYVLSTDYGRFPLSPDPALPYFGPGYKLDFPQTAGNCGSCHVPYAAVETPYGVDPIFLEGVATEGVGCDFCHKIQAVILNKNNMPFDSAPGVLSYELARPEGDKQIFFGPFSDMATGNNVFSPLYKQSRICAGCHYGKFWDTVVYNSYGEWLESDYADPITGKSCQDCHMPPGQTDRVVLLDRGGQLRNPNKLHRHTFSGRKNEEFIKTALDFTMEISQTDDEITVITSIKNQNAGHHFPTGSPLRHLILSLEVEDDKGQPVVQTKGDKNPLWTDEYAGMAGRTYAKVLEEIWTGRYPSAAYWNHTFIRSDNRIPANEQDTHTFKFLNKIEHDKTIRARLIYRYAYAALQKIKQWPKQDIILFEKEELLKGNPHDNQ